jgi:tetratricopeptide (TPR) repeat protein
MNSNDPLAYGRALRQQGRLGEAAAAFRQLLANEPHNGHALHLLGITVGQMGRPREAVELIRAALRVQPSNPVMHANLGNALTEIGGDAEAVQSYDRALALKPDLATTHHARGVVLLRLGQTQQALSSLQRALQLAPEDARTHNDLGVALERLGRNQEALEHFERAVALNPSHAEAHHNRGVLEMSLERYAQALESFERALALQPRQAAILANRGNALRALGRSAEALESYDRSLAIAAEVVAVHDQRGMVLLTLQRYSEALASFDRALALAADDFRAHFYRGVALARLEHHEQALASFDSALALNAQSAEALDNRGVELERLGRPEEALGAFAKAVLCKTDYPEPYSNAANTLHKLGRFEEALQQVDRALAIEPDHALSQWSKALIKLTLGEFAAGWPAYEARLRLEHLRQQQRSFAVPRWSGSEALAGKTILIHAEQGLGDTLQFCRYVPLLEAAGAQVVFEVPAALVRLMRSFTMRGTLLAAGEPRPEVDCHCPLLSLPLAFATQADTIPGGVPYLAAAAEAVAEWRERLRALPGLKIGLNWQGQIGIENQTLFRGRSFALACAAPLAQLSGVSLVSLQKGEAAEQRTQVEFGGALAQLTDPRDTGPDAPVETAALMKALDLVITSDTFMAHLAGALGVPVWVVLPAVADWRWLLDRSDSPWYPTMRLFRQRVAGDWPEVFGRVANEVTALSAERRPQRP